jgi:hypothetical protein
MVMLIIKLTTSAFAVQANLAWRTVPRVPASRAAITASSPADDGARATGLRVSAAATAKALLGTWRTKNRTAAGPIASSEAISKLFGVRWRTMGFRGCSNREEGGVECRFYDRKNDLGLAMLLERTGNAYRVTSLSFSSEAL